MISDELGLTIMNECDFEDYALSSSHNTTKSCEDAMNEAGTVITQYVNYYDVLLDVCYPTLVEQELRLKKMVRNQKKNQTATSLQLFVRIYVEYVII